MDGICIRGHWIAAYERGFGDSKQSNPDDEAKDTIIESVNNWNEKVDNGRKYLKDPWTSWLWNKNIVDSMEYIEIPEDLIK